MKRLAILAFVISIFSFTSCNTIKVTDTSLAGTWTIAFTGELSGSTKITINSDGSFSSGSFQLRNNNSNTNDTYSLRGSINASVVQSGRLLQNGTKVGDVDGNFVSNTGAGTYDVTGGLEGAWTAAKE